MRNEAVAVDRQMVARTVSELRAALPEADDLLVGLLRVAEATRTVLEVDGAGLTLAHEDGPPRWVAATDAAMELLEQVQHDFGEGPYLEAYDQEAPSRGPGPPMSWRLRANSRRWPVSWSTPPWSWPAGSWSSSSSARR
jgi:hypothetical protein